MTHPHVPGPDLDARDRGQDLRRLPGRDPGQDLRHRRPAGLLRRARSRHTLLRLIDPRRARLPRRQQEAQARHVPLYLCLSVLRPRLPGLLPAQTRSRQTALGQAVPAQAHHRILTLHAMTRNHTLHTPTSHETTHRHLTHHIGAPVDWLVGFGGASFINRRCAIVLTRVTSVSGRLGWAKVLDDVDSGARNPLRFCKSCGSFLCQISIVRVV